MKKGLYFFLLCFFVSNVFAQDSLEARIILIGDAGKLTNGRHPVVDAVKSKIPIDDKTTVVYLGDNLYSNGLPDNSLPTFAFAKAPLDSQITIVRGTNAKVFFIAGNHDWANAGLDGYNSIVRVQAYIDFLSNKNVSMQPRDGCPGPVAVDLSENTVLVMLDSQWWLQEYFKPGIESDCSAKTKEEVLVQLEDILQKNSDKLILFATHHPFRSYGPHGGYFTLKQHIFPFTDINPKLYIPLPVIGSIYPLTRAVFGTSQDIKHPFYQDMIHEIEKVTDEYDNIIYVAGHEHTLQYIVDSSKHFIVSGAGSKTNRVSKGKNSLYASSYNGFAVLEVMKSKNVYTHFYEVEPDTIRDAFDHFVLNFKEPPIETPDTLRQVEYAFKDSVVISASDEFKNWTGLKKIVLGTNYRKEWNTPISFKEFNIKKEMGGFKIESLGGGKQTKSLKLTDRRGKEWSLRSVEKDPAKALPRNLRGTIAEKILSDMISASYPYAPLVVNDLAQAAGVISAPTKFYFVPDDPALGYYKPLFANRVVMLENRDPTVVDSTDNSKSTGKIINKMLEDNDHHVDQEKVLTARLLDMLIGDFDRHNDQWKWGTADTGKGKLYYPLPRDRDQAFFKSNGLLVKYLVYSSMPYLEGFNKKIKSIKSLNYVARNFDRLFLNSLDKTSWDTITNNFINNVSDSVIMNSMKNLPDEIRILDSAYLTSTLIARKNGLLKNAMKYYKFISKDVTIRGSNKNELFKISALPKGMAITVYKKNKESDSATVMYKREFDEKVTREILLYGLNGDDKFIVDPDVKSSIKLRIIGGKGLDTFKIDGNVRNHIYDLSQEKNVVISSNKTRFNFSSNPSVIAYEPDAFEYDQFIFPQFNFGYNSEDGILAGVGFTSVTHGFRKKPYSTKQKFSSLFAPDNRAFQAEYSGEFNHVFNKLDLLINGAIVNPTLYNFYGLGNSTKNEFSDYYYRVRYKIVTGSVLVRKRINEIISFSFGPEYQRYWADAKNNKGRILQDPLMIGNDSSSVLKMKNYFGGTAKLDIEYINNKDNPTRGITWYNMFNAFSPLNGIASSFSSIKSDMTIYASVLDPSEVGAVFRLGGGHIFSDKFEYFQAMNLGFDNYLRGYSKRRFSGRSMAYTNVELKVKLFKSRSYILPGTVGVMGFFDNGRVWADNENSKRWHSSFGGGFYYFPYEAFKVSAILAYSQEEKMINISIGTKFNLTF